MMNESNKPGPDKIPFETDPAEAQANVNSKLDIRSDFVPDLSMQSLVQLIRRLSLKRYPVCIIGERGTGKELIADEYVKFHGGESKWYKINCASHTDELLNSALFGHVKGAFTGAEKDKKGMLGSLESGGGILMDELGAATPTFQAAILRVLQSGDYFQVGSEESKSLDEDVTILAATSEPDKIRPDVIDRFIQVHVPPLRTRRDDIPFIIKTLWNRVSEKATSLRLPGKISKAALDSLKSYSWPGNVRELNNSLLLAIVLTEIDKNKVIRTSAFPTIPTMSQGQDTSRGLEISKLTNQSSRIPAADFLRGWPPKKTDNPVPPAEGTLDSLMEKVVGEIPPKRYHHLFWHHYASLGYSAGTLLQKFPDIHKYSTVSEKLRKHKL